MKQIWAPPSIDSNALIPSLKMTVSLVPVNALAAGVLIAGCTQTRTEGQALVSLNKEK